MEKKNRTGSEIAPSRAAVADVQSVEASIRARIFTIRGVQVMLDRDLAALYGVEVKQLNRQVKRNAERFPDDFMFQLSREECLRCQFGTLNGGRGQHLKYFPYVFTENGVAMLSSVLRSPGAIAANIQIMRAFNAMRKALAEIAPVLSRLAETERRQLKPVGTGPDRWNHYGANQKMRPDQRRSINARQGSTTIPSVSLSVGSSHTSRRWENRPSSAIARRPLRSSLSALRVVLTSIAISPLMTKSTSILVRVRQ